MAQSTVKKGWFNVLNISKHDEVAGSIGTKDYILALLSSDPLEKRWLYIIRTNTLMNGGEWWMIMVNDR